MIINEEPKEITDEINDDLETVASGTEDESNDDEVVLDDGDEIAPTGAEDEGTTVVSFGDDVEGEGEDETAWIKELRERNRDQSKEIKALKREREQNAQPTPELGERPTMESAEFDAELYENQLTEWLGRKQTAEQQQWHRQQSEDELKKAYQVRVGEYVDGQSGFEKKAYAEAEETVQMALNEEQQYQMVHIAGDKAAAMVMGLAKNVKQMQELAAIKDRDLFAAAVGRLETKMKVSRTKPKTEVETRVASDGGRGGATSSSHLEELRKKAAKTGDLTEVLRYKKQLREQAA